MAHEWNTSPPTENPVSNNSFTRNVHYCKQTGIQCRLPFYTSIEITQILASWIWEFEWSKKKQKKTSDTADLPHAPNMWSCNWLCKYKSTDFSRTYAWQIGWRFDYNSNIIVIKTLQGNLKLFQFKPTEGNVVIPHRIALQAITINTHNTSLLCLIKASNLCLPTIHFNSHEKSAMKA